MALAALLGTGLLKPQCRQTPSKHCQGTFKQGTQPTNAYVAPCDSSWGVPFPWPPKGIKRLRKRDTNLRFICHNSYFPIDRIKVVMLNEPLKKTKKLMVQKWVFNEFWKKILTLIIWQSTDALGTCVLFEEGQKKGKVLYSLIYVHLQAYIF